jgi:hypothetical protein
MRRPRTRVSNLVSFALCKVERRGQEKQSEERSCRAVRCGKKKFIWQWLILIYSRNLEQVDQGCFEQYWAIIRELWPIKENTSIARFAVTIHVSLYDDFAHMTSRYYTIGPYVILESITYRTWQSSKVSFVNHRCHSKPRFGISDSIEQKLKMQSIIKGSALEPNSE